MDILTYEIFPQLVVNTKASCKGMYVQLYHYTFEVIILPSDFFQILIDLFIFMKFCGCHKMTCKVVIKEFEQSIFNFLFNGHHVIGLCQILVPNECEFFFMKHIEFIKAHYNESQTHNHEINQCFICIIA
jgi:hypothetical protein